MLVFIVGKSITCILGSGSIGRSSQFSFHDSLFKSTLMIVDETFDLRVDFLLFFKVLIIQFIDVLSTCAVCFIGKSHLQLFSFLIHGKWIDTVDIIITWSVFL